MKKNFKGFLYINYKTGHFKVSKRKSKSGNPWEICISLDIDVEVPELKAHVFHSNIVVSESQVKEMVLDCV